MNAAMLVAMARTVEGYNPDQPRAPRGTAIDGRGVGGRFISADAVLTLLRSTGNDTAAAQVERLAARRSSGSLSSAGGRLMSAQSLKRGRAAHQVNVAKADKLRASIRRDEERLSARKSAGDPLLNPGAAKDFHATLRRKRDELAELDADIAGYKAMVADHDRTFGGKPAVGAAEKLARAKVAELAGAGQARTDVDAQSLLGSKNTPQLRKVATALNVQLPAGATKKQDIIDAIAGQVAQDLKHRAADSLGRQPSLRELLEGAIRDTEAPTGPGDVAAAVAKLRAGGLTEGAVVRLLDADAGLTAPKLRQVAADLGVEVPDGMRSKQALQLHIANRLSAAPEVALKRPAAARGAAMMADIPSSAKGSAAQKVSAAKRAAKVAERAADVVAKLRAATSREEGAAALKGKLRAELVEIAKAAGVHHTSRATKTQLEAELVQWLVGRRLTSDAIRGV